MADAASPGRRIDAAWRSIVPPAFPPVRQYTRCYCEENTYLLVQHLVGVAEQLNQVANRQKLKQKQSQAAGRPRSLSLSLSRKPPKASPSDVFIPVWDVRAVFISNADKTVVLWEQNASRATASEQYPVVWDYHVFCVVTCTLLPLSSLSAAPANRSSKQGNLSDGSDDDARLLPSRTWVYDPDSRLSYASPGSRTVAGADVSAPPQPVLLQDYMRGTFRPELALPGHIPPQLRSCARVIDANRFLAHFASDRSHMKLSHPGGPAGDDTPAWSAPPPTWPLIVGHEAKAAGVTNNLMDRFVSMVQTDLVTAQVYGTVSDGIAFLSGAWAVVPTPGSTVELSTGGEEGSLPAKDRSPPAEPRRFKGRPLLSHTHSSPPTTPPSEPLPPVPPLPAPVTPPRMPQAGQANLHAPLHAMSVPSTPANQRPDSAGTSGSGRRGGRVTSPLFPAYLAESSRHRVATPPASPVPPADPPLYAGATMMSKSKSWGGAYT